MRDALNVITAAFIAFAVLALLALLNRNLKYFEYLTIPISILTIHFLINIVVLISSRFLFKQLYYLLFYGIKKERRVLIYGAGEAGLIPYSFLSGDKDAKVFVVGFLDNDSKKIGRRLNGSVIPLFKNQIEYGGPLTHKDITRFFMTIPEACQLVLDAGAMVKGGEIFVFDMGKSINIFDLAKNMIHLSGFKYPDYIDIKVVGL